MLRYNCSTSKTRSVKKYSSIGFKITLGLILFSLFAVSLPSAVLAASGLTSVSVYPTYNCAGITAGYSSNPGQVTTEYRRQGDTTWINATSPLPGDPSFPLYNDTGQRQLRGSLFWLDPNTTYELRLTDAGGSQVVTFKTRNDTPPSTGNQITVNPGQSIQSAVNSAGAGDVITVMPGTYSGFSVGSQGTANNYIHIKASGNVNITSQIRVTGRYIRISGFSQDTTSSTSVMLSGCSDVIIEDMVINDPSRNSTDSCIRLEEGASDCLIQRCHLTVYCNGNNEDKNGVYWWRAGEGNVFRDNLVDGTPWDGFGGGPEDESSTCNNYEFYRNTVIEAWDDGIQPEGGVVNTKCWSNTVQDSMLGFTDACSNSRGPLYIFRNQVYTNIAKRGAENNGLIGSGDGGSGRVYLIHNSYYGSGGSNGIYAKNYGVFNHVSLNNALYCGHYIIEYGHNPDGTDCDFDYDVMYSTETGIGLKWGPARYYSFPFEGQESHGEMVNPGFVNGQSGDLSLRSDSPCINTGMLIKQINDSLSPWPATGSAPDIGAVEYGSGGNPGSTDYTLTILTQGSGSTNPGVGSHTYESGSSVNVTATPAENYRFIEWREGNQAISQASQIEILMDSDHSITAVFQMLPQDNNPPVATNDTYSFVQNTTSTVGPSSGVLNNDSDPEGTTLTAVKASDPSHGSLTLNPNGSFTYAPASGYTGSDSFSYMAFDGDDYSNIATVYITITRINHLPVIINHAFSTNEDTPLNVPAPGVLAGSSDSDGDTLTAIKVSNPAHGTLTLNANGSFTYTPALNYNGSDSFFYKANDGFADSDAAIVTITVNSINDRPVASGDAYSVSRNKILEIPTPGVLINDFDVDNDQLTASLVSTTKNGNLILNSNGAFSYEPDLNYSGIDSFTYKANDGEADSSIVTVSITILTSNNSAPVAVNDFYAVSNDNFLNVSPGVLFNDTDADGDPLTVSLITDVSHGSLTLNTTGSFIYQPDTDFTGSDSFTYTANDGISDSNVATVILTVSGTSNNETGNGQSATFGIENGNNTYYEVPNVLDVIRFVNDAGSGTMTKLEVLFNDISPNGRVRLGVYADNNGKPGNLLLDAGEANVSNGWVSAIGLNLPVNNGTYYWLAFNLQNRNGVRYQSNQVSDSHYWVSTAYGQLPSQLDLSRAGSNNNNYVLRATVSSGETSGDNTPPMISNMLISNLTCDSVDIIWTTDEESTSQVEYSASPTQISPLDENLVTNHLVRLNSLEPDSTYTYTILSTDASGNLAIASGTFITPLEETNSSPVAVNDAYTVNQDSILNISAPGVLVNDTDVDGDPLTTSLTTNVSHGNLTLNTNGSFVYIPNPDFSGIDTFTYKANDGASNSNTATVTLTVNRTSNNDSSETFGIDDGNRTYYEVAGVINVIRLQNNAGDGKLTKLEILFNDISPNGKVRLGVYADNNGKPGNLLLDAGEVNVSNGWVSVSGLNLPVNEDAYYWLAFNLQDRNGMSYQSNYASGSHYWIGTIYGPLPAQFDISRANSDNNAFVLRATVQVVE